MEQIVDGAARDFIANESSSPQEYFVYFKGLNCAVAAKDPQRRRQAVQETCPVKRERGEFRIHPAVAPVSLMSADSSLWSNPRRYAHQADRTLRPFARRRARTLRPLEVAIL